MTATLPRRLRQRPHTRLPRAPAATTVPTARSTATLRPTPRPPPRRRPRLLLPRLRARHRRGRNKTTKGVMTGAGETTTMTCRRSGCLVWRRLTSHFTQQIERSRAVDPRIQSPCPRPRPSRQLQWEMVPRPSFQLRPRPPVHLLVHCLPMGRPFPRRLPSARGPRHRHRRCQRSVPRQKTSRRSTSAPGCELASSTPPRGSARSR